MKNSYRYFKNSDCQYFPCHDTKDSQDFNCLFCYCPLFLLEDCGGNYKFYKGIKDCSVCLIPHSKKGYDYINSKLSKEVFEKNKTQA